MYTLLSLIIGKFDFDDPITLNELRRMPSLHFTFWSRALAVLGGWEFVFTLPGCWIPFIHWLWRVPALLASAATLSREFEARTWHPLRSTPLTVRQIVMGKFLAVFRYAEPQISLVEFARAIPMVIFATSWLASTITVLPSQGFAYWAVTTLALLISGIYLVISPVLDIAMDAAIGTLASAMAQRPSTAVIIAILARLSGWLLPLALAAPLQYGYFTDVLGGGAVDVITLRALAVVSTFGPAYAFLWGIAALPASILVVVVILLRVGLIRLLLGLATIRAARVEF